MRQVLIALCVIVALAVGGWAYVRFVDTSLWEQTAGSALGQQQTTEPETAETEAEELGTVIWASGKLVPTVWANLAPMQGGSVEALHVKEGDWVESGAVLLQLNNPTATSAVEISAATVAEAEAAHAKLLAGSSEAEIAAAEATVATAEAQVALAAGQLLEAQKAIELAEVELLIAQEQYNELASGPTPAERAAAAARVDIAQAAVNHAQAAYNAVRGESLASSRPEALQLQQATESLEAAQAEFAVATQGATEQQLAVARARIQEAQARVAVAESRIPAAEAGIQSAQAALASAEAHVRTHKEGASAEDIAVSEARIAAAKAQLARAQAQVRQGQIVAPFAGQVGAVSIRSGELAAIGQTLVLLGDTQKMHVETTDLRETDVVHLQTGQAVEVTFDSSPDRIFKGVITYIAPVSTTDRGSTNFTVHVDVPALNESLRWGMTAFVNILVTPPQ